MLLELGRECSGTFSKVLHHMHNQQPTFGEILTKLEMVTTSMPGECGVHVYFPPLPTRSQGQGWGHTPLKSHLIYLPTLN